MFNTILAAAQQGLKKGLCGLIIGYQKGVSPWFPARCRFFPSCSHYAIECLYQYPIPKALGLIIKRLCKCHPLHPGGYDPVPERKDLKNKKVASS